MIKVYLFLIIMGVLGVVGYGGYMYYKDTQERIATLTANNAKLETAVQISEDLANKKPGLIERKMQNATNRLWDDLADITNPSRGVQSDTGAKSSNSN